MDCDADPPKGVRDIEPGSGARSQRIAGVVLATALVLLGLWILHRFLAALAWATILAIALWPMYWRLTRAFSPRGQRILAPLVVTLLVGLVLIVPLLYVAFELAREERYSRALIRQARERPSLDRRRRRAFDLAQVPPEVVLPDRRVQRRDRLLPEQRDDRVEQRQPAGQDQHHRDRAQRACAARAAIARRGVTCAGCCGGELELGHACPIVAEPTPCHPAILGPRRTWGRGS